MTVFRKFFGQLQRAGITPTIVLEVDPRRAKAVAALARSVLPTAAISIQRDLARRQRVVIVTPLEVPSKRNDVVIQELRWFKWELLTGWSTNALSAMATPSR